MDFFKKRWCVFWWGFPSPTNNLSFFTGADLRPSSPIPGHEGLRPPSWGCVVIRRGRWWFAPDFGCACAKPLSVTHRTSSGWDKTRDTARGFLAGTKWCGCSKKIILCFFYSLFPAFSFARKRVGRQLEMFIIEEHAYFFFVMIIVCIDLVWQNLL